jgi:hypothetical protein
MNDLTVLTKAGYVGIPESTTFSIYHFLNQSGEKVIIKQYQDNYENQDWVVTIDGSQQRGEEWFTKYHEEIDEDKEEDACEASQNDVLFWLESFVFFGSQDGETTIDFSTFAWAKGIAERRQSQDNDMFSTVSII